MNTPRSLLATATLAAVLFGAGAASAQPHALPAQFAVGEDAVKQPCRALRIYGDPLVKGEDERAYDLYCGGGDPVGRVYLLANPGRLDDWTRSLGACADQRPLDWPASDVGAPSAVLCRGAGGDTPVAAEARLSARAGERVAAGVASPPAAVALERATRILLGAARADAGPDNQSVASPLLASLATGLGGPASGVSTEDVQTLIAAGHESNALSLYSQAEDYFSRAIAAHRTFWPNDRAGDADLKLELAFNLSNQGRFAEARALFRESAEAAKDDPALAAKLALYQAEDALNDESDADRMTVARKRLTAARASLEAATQKSGRTLADLQHLSVLQAMVWRTTARVSLVTPDQARSALNNANGALDQVERDDADWLRALIARDEATLELSQHRPAAAADVLRAAIARLEQSGGGSRIDGMLKADLARALAADGHRPEALTAYRAAFEVLAHSGDESGVTADEAVDYFDVLTDDAGGARLPLDDPRAAELFSIFESVSRSSVQDTAAAAAARLAGGEDSALVRKWQDARRAALEASIESNRVAADAKATPAERADAAAAVKSTQDAAETLGRAVYEREPNYATLAKGPLGLDEIGGALTDQDVIVRLVVGGAGGAGLLVDKQGVTPFRLKADAAEVSDLVRRVKLSARHEGGFDLAASNRLYDALFPEVGPALMKDASKTRLIVDVQGSLAAIPFSILTTEPTAQKGDFANAAWLGRRFRIVTSAGLRPLAAPKGESRSFVGYGDFTPLDPGASKLGQINAIMTARGLPADACRVALIERLGDLSPLDYTRLELQAAQTNLGGVTHMGADFSPDAIMADADLGKAQVILLATHGVFRGVDEDASDSTCLPEAALLTSAPHGAGDMFLDTAKVLNLKLDARVVVLSACDTGTPVEVSPGETGLPSGGDALSGFARAFIYAGARDVVVTHWPVDDAFAPTFMNQFTAALKRGEAPDAALHSAQLASMQSPANADPFFWGPFTLVSMGLDGE